MYNLRKRPTGSFSLGRGIMKSQSPTSLTSVRMPFSGGNNYVHSSGEPSTSFANPNSSNNLPLGIPTSGFDMTENIFAHGSQGEITKIHDKVPSFLPFNSSTFEGDREVINSPVTNPTINESLNSHLPSMEREIISNQFEKEIINNPFSGPMKCYSDTALFMPAKSKSSEDEHVIRSMRQQIETMTNENLQLRRNNQQSSKAENEMMRLKQEIQRLKSEQQIFTVDPMTETNSTSNLNPFTVTSASNCVPNSYNSSSCQQTLNSSTEHSPMTNYMYHPKVPQNLQMSLPGDHSSIQTHQPQIFRVQQNLPTHQTGLLQSFNPVSEPTSIHTSTESIPRMSHMYQGPNSTMSGTATYNEPNQRIGHMPQKPRMSQMYQHGQITTENNHPEPTRNSDNNGRRNRVPWYNGKEPWSAYLMQFELIAENNNWTATTKAMELITALKDDAMVYASFLSQEVKSSFTALSSAMANRFGDHGYPETYRQELHTLRKQHKETIQEYASRVEMLVRKSLPTIDTRTHSTLSVEYMLRGLPDQSIALELLTKRIDSMTEAIHQVTLYETYKRGTRDRHGGNIRQLNIDDCPESIGREGENGDMEIRKVGGKRFVTEERLTQFERDIRDSMTKSVGDIRESVTKSVGEIIQSELTKFNNGNRPQNGNSQGQNRYFGRTSKEKPRHNKCYNCFEEGHYSKDCKKERRDTNQRGRTGTYQHNEKSLN